MLCISDKRHTKYMLKLTKTSSLIRNVRAFLGPSPRDFWQLDKSISNNFTFHLFLLYAPPWRLYYHLNFSKAELFVNASAHNSTLGVSGLILHSHPFPDYIMPYINILLTFFMSSGPGPRKAFGPAGATKKCCFSFCILPGQTFPSMSIYIHILYFLTFIYA